MVSIFTSSIVAIAVELVIEVSINVLLTSLFFDLVREFEELTSVKPEFKFIFLEVLNLLMIFKSVISSFGMLF